MAQSKALNPIADPKRSYTSLNPRKDVISAAVIIAGYRFNVVGLEVVLNVHGVLDTANVRLPIAGNPDLSQIVRTDKLDGAATCEIYIGFPEHPTADTKDYKQLQRVFTGIVDTVEPTFESNIVLVSMRNKGALLELERHTNTSLNELATSFVKAAAKVAGLAVVIKLADNRVPATLGEVFAREFMVGFQNKRMWDTLVQCAECDDVNVYVSGDTLYYVAEEKAKRKITQLRWGHDFMSFDGRHSPQFNKNIKVEVRTWNPKVRFSHTTRYSYDADGQGTLSESSRVSESTPIFGSGGSVTQAQSFNPATGKRSVSTTESSSGPDSGTFNTGKTSIPSSSSAETYIIKRPNLTREQANKLALTEALRISRNEFQATMTLKPSAQQLRDLTVDALIQTADMPYANWNTSARFPYFWPRRITIKCDMPEGGSGDGLTMEIEAVNHRLPTNAA